MQPRLKVLTLAVADLERSLAFYREGLGLPTEGIVGQEFEDGAVAFFTLQNGLMLSIFPAPWLAKDAKIHVTDNRLGAVSIGHMVASKDEVDAVVAQAEKAGAVVTDRPHDRFWGGYSGYFHDPDGHLWEISWHPQWSLAL
jgi:catechol 2,3-dioxygenase-like lactoylglutathione lyase family enzyme